MDRVRSVIFFILFTWCIGAGIGGYCLFERTLTDDGWWLRPIIMICIAAIVTFPFLYRMWRWLVWGNKCLGVIFNVVFIVCSCLLGFFGGNKWLATPESVYEETVTIQERFRKRYTTHGRRFKNMKQHYEYRLRIEFPDGAIKKVPASENVYQIAKKREDMVLTMQKGYFGYPFIVEGLE